MTLPCRRKAVGNLGQLTFQVFSQRHKLKALYLTTRKFISPYILLLPITVAARSEA
jgi:hypothetical protein